MTYREFVSGIKTSRSGSYFFYGDESYLKRHALNVARETLVPGADAVFNHLRLDPSSYSPEKVWNFLGTPPVLGDCKLIELSDLSPASLGEDSLCELEAILKAAPGYGDTVLILLTSPEGFDPGTQKQPSAVMKRLSAVSTPVSFDPEPSSRLEKWVLKHFDTEKVSAGPAEARLLINRCGCDMFILSNETEKLCAYAKKRQTQAPAITEKDIMAVTPLYTEQDDYALTDAILSCDTGKALAVIGEARLRREKPELILGTVSGLASSLYAVRQLIDAGLGNAAISDKLKLHEYKVSLYRRFVMKYSPDTLYEFLMAAYNADTEIKNTALDSYTVLELLITGCICRLKDLI